MSVPSEELPCDDDDHRRGVVDFTGSRKSPSSISGDGVSAVLGRNEFLLPRSVDSGQRSIPFYAAATSTARGRGLRRSSDTRSPSIGRSVASGVSRLSPTSSLQGGSAPVTGCTDVSGSTSAISKLRSDFDLPGRLFGAHRGQPFGGSVQPANASEADMRRAPFAVVSKSGTGGVSFGSPVVSSFADPATSVGATTACGGTHSEEMMAVGSRGRTMVSSARTAKPIDEAVFISDLLFMWIGVERTAYISFHASTQRYELDPEWGSTRQRLAVESFQECGTLARQIDVSLKHTMSETSFLQQSLRSALRRQLTQYHYLVASIRERQFPPLMFGDLVVAFKRVQPKLRAMHHVLTEAEAVKGGELVSKLQVLIHQGSHRLSALLSDMYIEAVSPLLHMTVSSITKGEVTDPFNEFFIEINPHVGEERGEPFWTTTCVLRPSMLPTTVPRALAEDILLVTKNVRFIKNCCRAKQWRMDPAIVASAQRASFDTLASVVRDALVFSNTAVMRFMREQFKMDDVFRVINAFLLVGYGDFYELLIGKLHPILSKLSHTIQTSYVRDQVTSALMEVAPYAKHLDTDRFSSLQCEVIKDESKLGWDAFILTLPLPSPVNNIIDATALKVYRRLFRTLFRVKVAEVSLKNAWRQSVIIDRIIGGLRSDTREMTAWREVAADAHLLGLQLNHFVINLWSYLVAEVSTVAWNLFTRALARCKSFDAICIAHNAYLTYLTQRCLLHNDCSPIRMNIENVLTIVREYCSSQALLTSLIERGSGEVRSIKRQYQSLTDDFHREMSSLLTTLEEQHLQYDFLNFLLLRLNFNRFYHDTVLSSNVDF